MTTETEGAEEFEAKLAELAALARDRRGFLFTVAEILAEEADLSIERAQSHALKQSTVERKGRGAMSVPFWGNGDRGLKSALMADAAGVNPAQLGGSGSPVALREYLDDGTLLWGTKRWVTHASYHMQLAGSGTKYMTARIDLLTGESAVEIEERIEQAGREWVAEQMEKSGFAPAEIRAALGDDVL